MLRQDSSFSIENHSNRTEFENGYANQYNKNSQGLELQQQLEKLEEMIVLDGLKVPLTGRTFISDNRILDQLEAIEKSIPEAIRAAERIINQREEIIDRAKKYAQELVNSAEQRAAQIADELTIIQQAEAEAQALRTQIQQEVEELRRRNISEMERVRRQTQQDIDGMRQHALREKDQLQQESDLYADRVLTDLERQLSDMLRVIKNGRMHLKASANNTPKSS
jgi:F0F1-type ATP synthase membrane subunit b/b'